MIIFFISLFLSAFTASATDTYVLPVPAGPMQRPGHSSSQTQRAFFDWVFGDIF